MRRIRLGGDFAHPPHIVWRYLTDHEGWSRWWPESRVKLLRAVGDSGVGTRRSVEQRLGWLGRVTLEEEVCGASANRRLEMRVLRGLPFEHHYVIIGLEGFGSGTRLSWRVNFEVKTPGLGWLLERSWTEAIEASLTALDRLMRAEHSIEGTFLAGVPLPEADAEWREQAAASCERLRQTALRFRKTGSNHYWFARAYLNVQEALLALVDQGGFVHPGWVLRLLVRWHELYDNNLRLWQSQRRGEVEYQWVEAFEAAEIGPRWWRTPKDGATHALGRGVWAHICEDLPRAIAVVFADHYEGREGIDYETFAEDFTRMHSVFEVGQRDLKRELPAPTLKDWLFVHTLPEPIFDAVVRRPIFDIRRERRRAWERGRQLWRMMSDPKGERGLRWPDPKLEPPAPRPH